LRHTSSVAASHSPRVQAVVTEGRGADRLLGVGAGNLRRRATGHAHQVRQAAEPEHAAGHALAAGEVRLRDLAGQVPIHRAATAGRRREHLLQLAHELLQLLRVVRVRHAVGETEAKGRV
jgi:hypothetical protein